MKTIIRNPPPPAKSTPSRIQDTASPSPASLSPDEDTIREYAYHLFELRHGEHGHDLDDWIEAESALAAGELDSQASRTGATAGHHHHHDHHHNR